jgi:flagellar hook-associated protein 2
MSSSINTGTTSTGSLFQASGLASGIDTASIVDKIIQADSAPMLQVQKTQTAYSVQISTIATLSSKLKAFQDATDALAGTGLAPILASSTYADFTVTGHAASEGDFSVRVESVARAAKMRSKSFTSAQDPAAVNASGNLQFSINGTNTVAFDVTGKSLADISELINKNVSGVTASVISTGSGYQLSVIRKDTGYTTATADGALQVVQGAGLDLATPTGQQAQNASVYVDGLQITRQSNSISGVIPGVTLNLTGQSNVASTVNFVRDTSQATTKINSFISAYNDVVTLLNQQLRPDPDKAATSNAVAGTFLYSLQKDMHDLMIAKVNSSGAIQTLGDLNVSLQGDGTLALDKLTFQKSFAAMVDADPEAANQIFTNTSKGLGALVDKLANRQLVGSTVDLPNGKKLYVEGALKAETKLLQDNISALDSTVAYWQVRLENERTRLTSSFTAMEGIISKLNDASNYMNQLFAYGTQKSSSK